MLNKKSMLKNTITFALASSIALLSFVGCAPQKLAPMPTQEVPQPTQMSQTGQPLEQEYKDAKIIQTDVAIVGGGGTGLVAALSAAENGKKVVLIEKLGYLGGATAMSAGKVPAAGTKQQKEQNINDTEEALARDILRPSDFGQRKELVDLVANNAKDFIEWSEKHGVEWQLETNLLYNGQTQYRMHVSKDGGAGIIKALHESAKANENITIMLDTPGMGLAVDSNNAVCGVYANSKEQGKLVIKSKAVVLATSGFGANKEMVQKYVPSIANAYPLVAPGATGEGIVWGMQLDANIKNMGAYQGYAPISAETKKGLGQAVLNSGGILVNKQTERFMDEVTGYSNLAANIVNQTDATAQMIWDETIATAQQESMKAWQEQGIVVSANTVEELAQKLKLDPVLLKGEFERYAQGIEKGEDYLNRTSLPKAFVAPFYAIEVTGDFRHTQGGLEIDNTARVISNQGAPIAGLYAGGGVSEGFSSAGGPNYMAGNGLLQAFVIGKIAGESASKY